MSTPAADRRPTGLWIAQGVVALIGLGVGLGVFALPEQLAGRIEGRLIAQAAARGIDLEIGAIWVEPFSALTLDDLTLKDAGSGAEIGTVGRLQVRYEVHGVTSPKVFLHEVEVVDPAVRLHRAKDGRLNVASALARLTSPGGGKGGGGGRRLRDLISRHVPRVQIRGLKLQVDDDQGGPLKTPAGVDLRHLRFTGASFELEDVSPVQETIALRWSGRTHVAGIQGEVGARGELQWPSRTGDLHLTFPPGFAVQAGGVRAAVEGVSATSEGLVTVRGVHVTREGGSGRLSLDVASVQAKVSPKPAPLTALPKRVRDKLPAGALLALRHVRRVTVERPVVVGTRHAAEERRGSAGGSSAPADEDAEAAARADDDAQDDPPDGDRTKDSKVKDGKAKGGKAKGGKAKGGKAKGGKAKDSKTRGDKAKKGTKTKAGKADGSKVREALRVLLTGASDKLEAQLASLREAMTALPLDEVVVNHGSARLKGEDAASAPTREVSDYNLTLARKEGTVTATLDFAVPGRKGTQQVRGRVVSDTGDMYLQVRLDHLPLAPYAAVLPGNVNLHDDSALHDTRLTVQVDAKDRTIAVEGQASLSHLDVRAPKLSRHVLADLKLRAKGRLTFDLAREQVRLDKGEFAIDKVVAMVSGSVLRYRKAPAFDLHAKVPTVKCQHVVDALVPGVAPMLEGMTCKGTLALRLDLGLDTADMRSLKLDYKPLLRKVTITDMGKYIRFDVLTDVFRHHARQKDGSLYEFVTGPGSDRWVPFAGISDHLVKVVTTTEDGSFFWHKGFSLNQIRSAFVANLLKGRFVRGASTISQQVVKNLFFVEREKTLARKLQEAVITWQMEQVLEKNQILELYFNIIEFGPKIYGIRAAANHYFARKPGELTLLQAIWLGSIIPNPKAFYHQFTRGAVKPSWAKYLCWIAGVMVKREKISAADKAALGRCEVEFGKPPLAEVDPSLEPEGLGHEGLQGMEGSPELRAPPPRPGDDSAPLPPPKLPTERAKRPLVDNPFAGRPKPPKRHKPLAPGVADEDQP